MRENHPPIETVFKLRVPTWMARSQKVTVEKISSRVKHYLRSPCILRETPKLKISRRNLTMKKVKTLKGIIKSNT